MPDISKINNVAVADISKLDSITFAHGQKVNNQDVSLVTDAHTLIATATATTSPATATLSFTLGLDSLYDAYEFRFMNMHPQTMSSFQFQVNATDGADFNDSLITSTHFRTYHRETGETTHGPAYNTGLDLAQQALYQPIAAHVGNDNDESASGVLTLFNPASTTYVKHFTSRVNSYEGSDRSMDAYTAGYINTDDPDDQPAITEISFKFASGNIDAGTIHMYGVG